jgi:hypothetical protein
MANEAKRQITDKELEQLAESLYCTGKNAERTLTRLYPTVEVPDDLEEQLREKENLFQCQECDAWLELEDCHPDDSSYCNDCGDAINKDEDDED